MSEETRHALGDLTNLGNKRGISSVLGDLLQKSVVDESGKSKSIAYEDSRVEFSKRLCLVVNDLVKGNASPVDRNKGFCSSDDNKNSDSDDKESEESRGDVTTMVEASKEIYFEPGDRYGARELTVPANVNQTGVTTTGKGLDLSVLSSNVERESSLVVREELPNCQNSYGARELNVAANAKEADVSAGKGLVLSVLSCDVEREKSLVVREGLSNCKNLRSFEMSRCSNVNKQDLGNDLLKSCSCSFCLKAAYIWSDLQYQDIKGRLSALKKSQKEASNLIRRNDKERPTDLHASINSATSAKLESDLMGQWRSLFLSMGDILAQESNQLQNSFLKMRELREDCKIDLERETKTPQRNNT
uniref:Uncharacterized protein n=1 Tax=Arabis alpina TaxID=50452 RepID=C3UJS4_ARAAL|nr:hypothetical protein [Arabis alpina]